MDKAYDEDRRLYERGKPANRKLKYFATLKTELTNVLFKIRLRSIIGTNSWNLEVFLRYNCGLPDCLMELSPV